MGCGDGETKAKASCCGGSSGAEPPKATSSSCCAPKAAAAAPATGAAPQPSKSSGCCKPKEVAVTTAAALAGPGAAATADADADDVKESVQDYYSKVLQHSDDLKTNACCTGASPPKHMREALKKVHDEVLSKYYGCGLVLPEELEGARVLDLGCGAGRDVYVLAQFVGEGGAVLGVDMTDEQLDTARSHEEWHRAKFDFAKSNVGFQKGYIEKLGELGLADDSFDLIVSNCVINLSPDKEAVLREAYRLLKPGGELYFSDVYSASRVPAELGKDPVLWGECLSGALFWQDFERLAQDCGFKAPRLVSDSVITIQNKQVEAKIGHIDFYSATYRLFKLPELERDDQDYGQAVVYEGSVAHHPHAWALDAQSVFCAGKVTPVDGNTFRMLQQSRFAKHFRFVGDFAKHFGPFARAGGPAPGVVPFESATAGANAKTTPVATSSSSSSSSSSSGCC